MNLEPFDEHLLFSLERRYLDFIDPARLELATNPVFDEFDENCNLRMIRLDEVSHEGSVRQGLHLLHMQNVLAAMKDDSHTLVSVVRGHGQGASLYYGLAKRRDCQYEKNVSTDSYAKMLGATMHGNFLGAGFTPLTANDTLNQITRPLTEHGHALAFPGIPSIRVREHDAPYVQGVDRFIEGMRGEEYCLVVIAEPMQLPVIDGMITNLFNLGTSIHAQVRTTIQKMKGSSDTINIGMFGMSGKADSVTEGTADTEGESRLGLGSVLASGGALIGGTVGSIIFPGVGTAIGVAVGGAISTVGAWLTGAPMSKVSSFTHSVANTASSMTGMGGMGGYARGWNRSITVGREELNKTAEHCEKLTDAYIQRLQKGKNLGFWNVGVYLLTKDNSYTQLRGKGLLRACFSGDETHWEPVRNVNVNSVALNKYILNFSNPLYNLFLYGEETRNVEQAVSAGRKVAEYASRMGRSVAEMLGLLQNVDPKERYRMLEEIRRCPGDVPRDALDQAWAQIREVQLGHPLGPALGGVSTPLNTEELSIIMNVPRQEVQGVSIRPSTSFGVNYALPEAADVIRLGRVIHKRAPVDSMPYLLPRKLLQKHLFACGVTGSGKTNTCMGLLRDLGLPFMVIEPAKTEYRQMLACLPDLKVFTLGGETVSPFRINPFEFTPGSNLLTHVDNLKSVFSAAFPMYAAMPYILEEAIIEVYQDKGWELATSTNIYLDGPDSRHEGHGGAEHGGVPAPASERFYDFLPTMQDLYEKIDNVVHRKLYAQEQTMNYSAALKARISSLLTGSKGLMLNTRRSTPMATLLKQKVVLELKHIGDDEEKCFIMGLILSSIYEYRESHGRPGSDLKHVLLIEEAHRLLRRVPEYVSPEVGNTRGKAVETFANVISEIRTLGQGLIVVDQIPSKLTQDVIKNTNMKIVHRTLAKDDRDYVGSAMNLNDEQSRELSLLRVGQAVIHREGMDKAFLVQIDRFVGGDAPFVTNQAIRESMRPFHAANAFVFRRHPGFEKHPDIPRTYAMTDFRTQDRDISFAVMGAFVLMLLGETTHLPELRSGLHDLITRRTRKGAALDLACHVIHYASRIFSELNMRFPGCYDRCLAMNQIFIDLWFDGIQGFLASADGTLDVTAKRQMTTRLRQDMLYILRDERLTIPFFLYYIKRIDPKTPKGLVANWHGTPQDMDNLDAYLHRVVRTLLSGATISETAQQDLANDLLVTIFRTDSRGSSVLKQYRKRKEGKSGISKFTRQQE